MENQLKKTCLHAEHVALGAKMSPFAGYDMPIQYTSIAEEHNAVRNKCGVFDVSHMGEIIISGPDAEKFMNYIFTGDVSKLSEGQCIYGMLLFPDGGTVDDLLVYKEYRKDHYLLVVNAANLDKDYRWIKDNSEGFIVNIINDSDNWGQLAVQGRDSEAILGKILNQDLSAVASFRFIDTFKDSNRVIISRTGYTGEDGFEVYAAPDIIVDLWKALLEAGVTPCGLGCRDTLRFEAGFPLYGHELSQEISPVVAGLSIFCNLDKEEFIGKDAIAAQKAIPPAKKIVGIELADRAIPRAGYPVLLEDGTVAGEVTTGYRSISLDKSICFALVDRTAGAMGATLYIQIHRKIFPGTVVKKRFYQTNYKK